MTFALSSGISYSRLYVVAFFGVLRDSSFFSDFYLIYLFIFDQPLLRIDFLPACIHLAADRTGGNVFERGHDVSFV